ncbi:MAG: BlaI/MecI/CopY family transcriptional regulator [Gemmatimonadales bacterium]
MSPRPLPTDAELAILGALWERGPSTVREVHEALESRKTGYTTVLKLLQIMLQKGLVTRSTAERSHTYRAAIPRERTERRLVDDLAERAFGGSAHKLALHALESAPASQEELAEIRALLDRLERERRG